MTNRILVIVFFAVLFTFFACSEAEQKLEVYSPEAFAFNIGTEWELNASAQVKGFTQVEDEKEYSTKLSYYVNLITPSNETLEEIDYGMINRTSPEKLMDTQLEIQIVFDSTFAMGDYTLQIFVMDDLSDQQDSTQVKFTLAD
ncbi:MAG: hypothetical protein M5R37_08525 [Melioribacteraceae bacterium]|nr:hypothetical protein [Melioribacteraceae bacterium]